MSDEGVQGEKGEREDQTKYVEAGDVLAAARALLSPRTEVRSFTAKRATINVQGFTSLMLRVTADVYDPTSSPPLEATPTFIVKRLPLLSSQQQVMSEGSLFEREVAYFTLAVPILEGKLPRLPLPKCLTAHDTTVVLEDLSSQGYRTFDLTLKEMGRGITDVDLVRLIFRNLAKLHVASLGTDWRAVMPEFTHKDVMFEFGVVEILKSLMISASNTCQHIAKLIPFGNVNYVNRQNFIDWLKDIDKLMQTMRDFVKPRLDNCVNVLSHGDFWMNNMMFKFDSQKQKAIDVKFVDFQIIRLCSPVVDLHYFLYMCTSKEFREKHEKHLLQTYAEAFNTYVCTSPDLLTFEKLEEEFEKFRLFGALIGVMMKTVQFTGDEIMSDKQDEMTEESFQGIMFEDKSARAIKLYQTDEEVQRIFNDMVRELKTVADKSGVLPE